MTYSPLSTDLRSAFFQDSAGAARIRSLGDVLDAFPGHASTSVSA